MLFTLLLFFGLNTGTSYEEFSQICQKANRSCSNAKEAGQGYQFHIMLDSDWLGQSVPYTPLYWTILLRIKMKLDREVNI